ncbi:glycerol-3-phosphate 1-O-acyltransferase PlsB [Alkanindiges illinoisensis]|uniref:glycerol-3-phosphate 1-O-acyltransferase PlsB n=1 Tax=Alkanindiges illinoisensis TaxID=197183 RepID=UPI00047E466E|nr:glycerol-3-phosphate 1-O-acyltransferase PlsB [Alkanindiges illinoisensis]
MAKKNSFSQMYRRVSGKLLSTFVTPQLLGESGATDKLSTAIKAQELSAAGVAAAVEAENGVTSSQLVCYILQNYSRSNALVLDSETRRLELPPALDSMDSPLLNEDASILFLQQRAQRNNFYPNNYTFPPRLLRLIEALEKNPELDIQLVPVTVLWGRAPEKEESWFKLLVTDSWATPSALKQLVNIGVHGRQTYLEFHEARSLRQMLNEALVKYPNLAPATYIVSNLTEYLAKQREVILGPDLSDRRNVVSGLIQSRDVQNALKQEVIRSNITPAQAEQMAAGYLDEIVSDYSPSSVRVFERGLAWLWTQLYDGVEVHHFQTVRELAEKYEIIYTPCHRSHIDYLLLSYVIYKRGLMIPYIAAGDNLNLPLLGQFLRGGGAFFIRRSFKGLELYSAVLKEYLHSILVRNTPLEYFIEGGRSRTGRLLRPRTGMLAMTIHSKLRGGGKPVVFIPTYFGYERLMEGGTYVGEMQGKPKEAESIFGLIQAARKIERIFGKVHVSFGEPVFLDKMLEQHNADKIRLTSNEQPLPEEASAAVNAVAQEIMQNINRAAVINPVSLLSLVLLSTPKHALDEEVCIKQLDTYRRLAEMAPYDERVEVTSLPGREIIGYGLKLKLIKRVHHVLGDIIAIEDNQAVLLTYFRNNILHLFILPSLIASLVQHNGKITREDINSVIQTLYPFLQAELFLKWQADHLPDVIDHVVEALIGCELIMDDGRETLYSPAPNSESYNQLGVLATPVKQSLERYFMTLALLRQRGSGRVTAKQIEDLSHLLGQRLSVLYEFNSPEFFDKTLFQSFIGALTQLGYIRLDENQVLYFDETLINMADNARLVLDEDTMNHLQHITNFSDEEVIAAIAALEKQKSRRKRSK